MLALKYMFHSVADCNLNLINTWLATYHHRLYRRHLLKVFSLELLHIQAFIVLEAIHPMDGIEV
jgi:hypothetical protein